jgi:hypothetical protein
VIRVRDSTLLLAAVAVVVVLAGCSGGGGGTTPTATVTDGAGSPTPTDASTPTDGGGGTATSDGVTATPTATDDPSVDVEELRSAAVDAIGATDAYRVSANVSAVLSGPATQEVSRTVDTVVDREAREFRRNVTANVMGRESESAAYLVDRNLYVGSEANVRQYSSRWIQLDVSSNFSSYWNTQDTLAQMQSLIANASTVELAGTDAVGGTSVAVLSVELAPGEFRSVFGDDTALQLGGNVSFDAASYTLRVAPGDGRLLAATSQVNATVSLQGQTLQQNASTTYRFNYDVSPGITLPDAAADAVNVSQSSQGRTGSLRPPADGGADGELAVRPPWSPVLAADP